MDGADEVVHAAGRPSLTALPDDIIQRALMCLTPAECGKDLVSLLCTRRVCIIREP
jgi:hypothetical protein